MAALTISKEEVARLKGMGFLNNKGTDNFSARVITVNGRMTAAKQRCVADAAEKFGEGILTFTSRLTIEVPGIPYDKVEEFQAYIAKEGLVTGGTGSKVRPIVSCKGTTCQYGNIDTFALSEEIHHRFFEGFDQEKLPHKFKIAVGGCMNKCVKPDLNDIGIIGKKVSREKEDGTREVVPGYRVFLGGHWGKSTGAGREMRHVFTDREELLNVVEKAIRFYQEKGQPGERFYQVIERIGFEQVEEELLK